MTKWICIDDSVKEIKDEPWSLYWSELKPTSPEFAELIKEPLKALSQELSLVKKDWQVSSEIINHHVGGDEPLPPTHCALALVFPREKLVKLLMYRHPPGT
jgi:hypothetical protein